MSKLDTVKKVMLYQKDKTGFVKEPSMSEMADLVVLVLSQIKVIENAIKAGRLDGKTPIPNVDYLSKDGALALITKGVNDALAKVDSTLTTKSAQIDADVRASLERIRDGKDGIVSEEEIQRAAEVAFSMLELPDFDTLVTTHITSSGEAIRDALELLSGEDRYKVQIADIDGLTDALNTLSTIRTANGGTIGKQQVYNFIRQAIADGTITSGGVSDGDKGDITVSGSGTTWSIDNDTVGLDELSATGTPSAATFLRGDNTWATPAGSGDVAKVGTPVNNQVGVWTGDGTLEGDTALTFDTATDTLSTGNIAVTGTVDGRDIATDGTKLDGIEAGADVTDATNVASAGAIMDGDFTVNGLMKRTGAGTYGTATAGTDYAAALGADDNYVTDAEKTKLSNLSGTNSGDQTSIVGITGTKAQFDTAVTDGNFLYVGDITQYTDELAQDAGLKKIACTPAPFV